MTMIKWVEKTAPWRFGREGAHYAVEWYRKGSGPIIAQTRAMFGIKTWEMFGPID